MEIDSPRAWLVVAAAFLSTFTTFGVAYSFGAFFGPMADEFGTDRGATALFFSITTFLYFALGVVTGHVADRHGPRRVLLFGTACLVIGLLLTARVPSIWLGYLTYGVGVGIGVACAYVPMVANVGAWFEHKRSAALGVAVAGIGVGTLTVTPLNEFLVESYGWRRTYEILAAGSAVLLVLAAMGARRPPASSVRGQPRALTSLLRASPSFWLLYVSIFLVSLTLFLPFVFLADYLEERNISGSAGLLVGSIGISSVVGRVLLGRLAGRVAARRLYNGCILVMALSFVLWLVAGSSYALLVAFTIVLGIAYGGFIALAPAVIADIFGPVGLGAVLGALYTAAGVGGLIGPPVAGRMLDAWGYRPMLIVAIVIASSGYAVLAFDSAGKAAASAHPRRLGEDPEQKPQKRSAIGLGERELRE